MTGQEARDDEREIHVEGVMYADDIAEGGDPVPEDYERHYCEEDGEDWPCSAAREIDALAYLITAKRFHERGIRAEITEAEIAVARPMAAFLYGEGYRKHPAPEITGATWDYAALVEEAERVYAGAVAHDVVDYDIGLIQRLGLALHEAALRVPVGEGEQPAPKATLVDERDPACVAEWPECGSGEYDPRCCRFPKSCSAGIIRLVTPGEGEQ